MKAITLSTPRQAHEIANAAGRDAANRQMRSGGRARWNEADRELASSETMRLYTSFGILNADQWLPAGVMWKQINGEWQPVRESARHVGQ